MDQDPGQLLSRAQALASAARQLAESAAAPGSAAYLPVALERIGETLDALSRVFEGAAQSLVPRSDRFERVGPRFKRAAAEWPATHGCEAPSHERQAQLLSSLYQTGATMRESRRASQRASELLTDLTSRGADTDRGASAHHAIRALK